jgi:hypothetical protein
MKKYSLPTKNREHFPISFSYISYWRLSDETERIDNFNDPFFDGILSKKYQTPASMPISHFKMISKIIDLNYFENE